MLITFAVRFVTVDVKLVTEERLANTLATTSMKPLAFSWELGARPRICAENPVLFILFWLSIEMSVPAVSVQLIIPF